MSLDVSQNKYSLLGVGQARSYGESGSSFRSWSPQLGVAHANATASSGFRRTRNPGRLSTVGALVGALILIFSLAEVSLPGGYAPPEKMPPRHAPIRAVKALRFMTHYRMASADSAAGSAQPEYAENLNDDETSDDPNDDDDAWDELSANYNSTEPVLLLLPRVARGPNVSGVQSVPAWTSPLTFSFLALQRLRC
jgi:hypothetical protein